MKNKVPLPEDEQDRLRALRSYDILDTLPERAYDDITAMASQIAQTPVALVSLVDEDRQWFKSAVGLDATETPRNVAFCAHAITEPDRLFEVKDASKDKRFADNPLVTDDPRIRFYAGAPLTTADGHALGTLCVIDKKPRELTPEQSASLRALSRQVVAQLELRRSVAELKAREEALRQSYRELKDICKLLECQASTIEQDLHRAETIQRSLLPHTAPQIPNFCVQTLYRPGRSIGGDLFDVVGIADRYVAFFIADASGHGVSAAMLSVLFKNRLRVLDRRDGSPLSPSEALARVNEGLFQDVSLPDAFVTAALCLLDTETRELRMASAGHTPVLLLGTDGSTRHLEATGPAIGLAPDAAFEERATRLADGDRLLLFTDGLLDVGGRTPPSPDTIAEALRQQDRDCPHLDDLLMTVSKGQEREDRDDVTILLLEARSGESHFYETTESLGLSVAEEPVPARISAADANGSRYLAFEGRITWIYAQALLDTAETAVEQGSRLLLDFARCDSLDSAMLGTLHALTAGAVKAGTGVRLQNVSAQLRSLFEELSLREVMGHLSNQPEGLPRNRTSLELQETDLNRQRQRLLHAHEVLAALSDTNRDQFAGVIEALRSEVASP